MRAIDLWSIWSWHKSFSEEEDVNTSEDERKELQEIPAAELQQFAIKFVLGVRKKNGKANTLVYIIRRKLLDDLKNNILLIRCACS